MEQTTTTTIMIIMIKSNPLDNSSLSLLMKLFVSRVELLILFFISMAGLRIHQCKWLPKQ